MWCVREVRTVGAHVSHPRWPDWTRVRVAMAVVWVLGAIGVGLLLFLWGSFGAAELFGTPPSSWGLLDAAQIGAAAAFLIASGPGIVWLLTRRSSWLAWTAGLLGLFMLPCIICFVNSFSARDPFT